MAMESEKREVPDYKRCWLALKERSAGIAVRKEDGELWYPVTEVMNELERLYPQEEES
jgi:hypothetical protein